MSTLIDRMAAVLRDVMLNGSEADLDAAFLVLAEYDALRAATTTKPRAQVGQWIRVVDAQLEGDRYQNGEEGIVVAITQKPLEEGVRVDFQNGQQSWFLYHSEYEIIPNLPATNTGD